MGMLDILKLGKMDSDKDRIANLIKMDPDKLKLFEKAYRDHALNLESDELFEMNSKQASDKLRRNMEMGRGLDERRESDDIIKKRIVKELLAQTLVYRFDGTHGDWERRSDDMDGAYVTREELQAIPEVLRPQLTGTLMKVDINQPSYRVLLSNYDKYLNSKNSKTKRDAYNLFRQGLDILDLDEITYKIIGTNKNSMGYWFPRLVKACEGQSKFRLPATAIAKVPITLLQLTRQEYGGLTKSTLDIVDQWAYEAFELEDNNSYFIKTGTYSSKFDFRNAKVSGVKEVRELGEYLLYIHHQALMMASPFCTPCIYGVSTTNEWVVREFIEDTEENPCIYKGLPLHTEYRVFVDCDTDEVLGIVPYWEPETMKNRFGNGDDKDSPHQLHDYVIYKAHEEKLMVRYTLGKDKVVKWMEEVVKGLELSGQWSIDIMQNGEDFWIIDMALAEHSAFYDCVPKKLRRPMVEDWLALE